MPEIYANVSDDAVTEATGHGWDHWFGVLDEQDATTMDHKGRVAALADAGLENPWWHQQVAVGYEQARGLREVGETADAGYQVGVQRTVSVGQSDLWNWLSSDEGLETWLGAAENLSFDPGVTYETTTGTTGEIRTVAEGERVRLTWQPAGRGSPTTLQVTLASPRNDTSRTTIRFHHEKFADAAEREAMREHWQAVLDAVETATEAGDDA